MVTFGSDKFLTKMSRNPLTFGIFWGKEGVSKKIILTEYDRGHVRGGVVKKW
jgi:hypothetical protein